jgi:hypothetical protein
MKTTALLCLLVISDSVLAQAITEFKKGYVVPLEIHQGFLKSSNTPELYLIGIQVAPQWTIWEKHLRLGPSIGGYYSADKITGVIGPRATIKLLEGPRAINSATFNVHLLTEYLFGTDKQRLLGGGVGGELYRIFGRNVSLTIQYHRDLQNNVSMFRTGLSISLDKYKRIDIND